MMDTQAATQTITYEQQLLGVMRTLSREQRTQVLDYALFVKSRQSAAPLDSDDLDEERAWGQTAIRSLAKYWDTEEEDEAWAYLQKETS